MHSYLKRSSKAWRALGPLPPLGPEDFVSRSTVVRGSKSAQVLSASFGEIRAGTGFWHSKAALESKFAHCAHACRNDPHFEQVPSGLQAVATVNSLPQRAHRTTSRKPGMLNVFGEMGGWPRGVYSFLTGARCSVRGCRGSSW